MGATKIERAVKLESDRVLDLGRLGGEPLQRRNFVSTYHDTPEALLARCGITLRRRLENGRNDWQLKLPANGHRREVEEPGGAAAPPGSIAALIVAFTHGRPLVQLARLRTTRDGVLLRADTGIAEVVNDDVAVLDGQKVTQEFREVEIELIAGDSRTLETVERAVTRLGARRTDGRTTIARALGLHEQEPKRAKSDAERIERYFARRYVDLLAADPGVRLGIEAEAVHDLRVAVRRLRSLLGSARATFVRDWADGMRDELDWLGSALAPLRDLDVFTAHLSTETAELVEEDRAQLAPAFAVLAADHEVARANALVALSSERYFALLEMLASPPELVDSKETLADLAAAQLRKVRKLVRRARDDGSDELLHKARINAKRLRYLAEALGEERVVRRAKGFQDVVGEHQDAVVAEQQLRGLALRVPGAALPLGVLIERERERRVRMRRDVPKSWRRLERAARRAWK